MRSSRLLALLASGLLLVSGCWPWRSAESPATALVARGGRFRSPKWSPDGQRIVVVHLTDQERVEVWDPAGHKLQTIAETSSSTTVIPYSPGWHGDHVAYLERSYKQPRSSKLIISAPGDVQVVELKGRAIWASWSRDGRYAAVKIRDGLYLLDAESWRIKRIWTEYLPQYFSISPTGRYVAMVDDEFAAVSVFEVATGHLRELWRVDRPGNGFGDLMWSPDEAYLGVRLTSNKEERTGFYLLTLEGSSPPFRLTTMHLSDPDWSPDGERIVYATLGVPGQNELRIWELPRDWRERATQSVEQDAEG